MFKKGKTDANETEVHRRVQEPGGAASTERGKDGCRGRAREYELTGQMINEWKAQFLVAAPQAFESNTPSSGEAERIAELEQWSEN